MFSRLLYHPAAYSQLSTAHLSKNSVTIPATPCEDPDSPQEGEVMSQERKIGQPQRAVGRSLKGLNSDFVTARDRACGIKKKKNQLTQTTYQED